MSSFLYQLEVGSPFCYWILPALFDRRAGRTDGSVVIVVSPLHALKKDQIEALTWRDATAVYMYACVCRRWQAVMDAILLDRADNLTDTAGDNGLPTRSPRLSDDLFLCTGVLTSEETEGAVSDITQHKLLLLAPPNLVCASI